MSNDINDFLMSGGGAPPAKFDTVGRTYKGTVISSEIRQQTTLEGEAKIWDDGRPMMQAVITLQTDERDPQIEDDDGHRRLFVKGEMQKAVKEAVLAAKAGGLEIGGTLAVRYTGDGEPKKRGYSAPKLYTAQYIAPSLEVNDLIGVGAGNGSAPQTVASSDLF